MQESATVPPDEAARTLAAVRSTRQATRERLSPYWFPLVLYGVLMVVSAFLLDVWDGAGVVAFWLVATPIAMFVVAHHQRGEARTVGATRRGWKYLVALTSLAVASIVFGVISAATGDTDLVANGPAFVIPALLAFIAVRDRDLNAAAWALGITTFLVVAIFLLHTDGHASTFALCSGATSIFEGYTQRKRSRE